MLGWRGLPAVPVLRGQSELTIVCQDGFAPAAYRQYHLRHPKQQRECRIVASSLVSNRAADRDVIQFVPRRIVPAIRRGIAKSAEGEPMTLEFIPSKQQGISRLP